MASVTVGSRGASTSSSAPELRRSESVCCTHDFVRNKVPIKDVSPPRVRPVRNVGASCLIDAGWNMIRMFHPRASGWAGHGDPPEHLSTADTVIPRQSLRCTFGSAGWAPTSGPSAGPICRSGGATVNASSCSRMRPGSLSREVSGPVPFTRLPFPYSRKKNRRCPDQSCGRGCAHWLRNLPVQLSRSTPLAASVSDISRMVSFCQIFRDKSAVKLSMSLTESSTTGSCRYCAWSAASLLVSANNSEQ